MASSILASVFLLMAIANSQAQRTLTIHNRCSQDIWVATSAQEPQAPGNGGFFLPAGGTQPVPAGKRWTGGRIWARTGCNSQGTNCQTGDCRATSCQGSSPQGPTSLIEITLGDQDSWNLSVIDGYNVPIAIEPVQNTVHQEGSCQNIGCAISNCPNELRDPNGPGCFSGCQKYGDAEHCCPGDHLCQNCGDTDAARSLKQFCPTTMTYACDNKFIYSCRSEANSNVLPSYNFYFC